MLPENMKAFLGIYYPTSPDFNPTQIATYMFTHGNFMHILFNMFSLIMFGPPVEYKLGAKKFLAYYFLAGIGALLLQFGAYWYAIHFQGIPQEAIEGVPLIGASGAIFGILAAYGMLFPNDMMMLIFPPIPMKAKYMVLIFMVFELYQGVWGAPTAIAHFAHLGGAIFGGLIILFWKSRKEIH
jgi:rhomboid-like protein